MEKCCRHESEIVHFAADIALAEAHGGRGTNWECALVF